MSDSYTEYFYKHHTQEAIARIVELEREVVKLRKMVEDARKTLSLICAFDLKPYENDYTKGAAKLKLIAYEGLNNE